MSSLKAAPSSLRKEESCCCSNSQNGSTTQVCSKACQRWKANGCLRSGRPNPRKRRTNQTNNKKPPARRFFHAFYLLLPPNRPQGSISAPPVRIRQQGIIQKACKMPKVKTNSSAKKRFKVT